MPIVDKDRFSGFADLYDSVRPQPPLKVVGIIRQLKNSDVVGRVVDLGSGTGLSTAIWEHNCSEVIGIEPTDDMRNQAHLRCPNIRFINANSYSTSLESKSVDVVLSSQSFHWMEPVETLKEVNRILSDGGIFANYDCSWPVKWHWEAEKEYIELIKAAKSILEKYRELKEPSKQFPKEKHLENMIDSNYFAYWGIHLTHQHTRCSIIGHGRLSSEPYGV